MQAGALAPGDQNGAADPPPTQTSAADPPPSPQVEAGAREHQVVRPPPSGIGGLMSRRDVPGQGGSLAIRTAPAGIEPLPPSHSGKTLLNKILFLVRQELKHKSHWR